MTVMSNPVVVAVRALGRSIGFNKVLARFILGKNYEERFSTKLEGAIQRGDTVWDIGANVGYYSSKFAELAGPEGRVLAFEPSPTTYKTLCANTQQISNLTSLCMALSNQKSTGHLQVGDDELRATSRVGDGVGDASKSGEFEEISLFRADEFLSNEQLQPPNLVKIDVEGHERLILEGFGDVLKSVELRDIFVEMHFGEMRKAGRPNDAGLIESMLKDAGFSISWTDPSHIHASRH